METKHPLQIEKKENMIRLTLDRPEALNALNQNMLEELLQFFSCPPPSDCFYVALRGAGEKAFAAGADVLAMAKMDALAARNFSRFGQEVMSAIENYPRPVVAFVHGFALGGGCELALACDFIIASPSSKFGQPEVGLGLIPGFGGTQRLGRKVGVALAADMILTGQALEASRALAAGLCTRIVERDQFDEQERILAKIFSRSGLLALAQAKRLLQAAAGGLSLKDGLKLESECFAEAFYNGEGASGMKRFLEKSK